jgi:FlaA1/EpsC-like NDP-sugar epimerase
MMEKVMVATSRNLEGLRTVFCGTRYDNVMASRGSVIPVFIEQIREERPLTNIYPAITRFMLSPGGSADLVQFAFQHDQNGDIFVQKTPANLQAGARRPRRADLQVLNASSEICGGWEKAQLRRTSSSTHELVCCGQ